MLREFGSPMGSGDRRRLSTIGMPGIPPRRWSSPLLTEELSLGTLQDTTYVRLLHPDDVIRRMCSGSQDDAEEGSCFEVSPKGTRSEKAWSWLKRPVTTSWNYGRDVKETVQVVMAKSKSQNTWAWLPGKPPATEFQFDPTKRWPQGW